MRRILLVDDSPIARMVMKRLLKSIGHTDVIEADNGSDAIDLYEKHEPDIMFLDLTMPEITGYDVLARIRSVGHDAYVVVLTADRQEETAYRVRALGAKQVMHKPPKSEDVADAIREAIAHAGTEAHQ